MITNNVMKRINNLFDKIVTLENLRLADEKARKGKLRSYGVLHHERNKDENIYKLYAMLVKGEFKTSQYHVFKMVTDANKERTIYRLPYYPDRILHHAIMNVMEPIWVNIFTNDTYSCIKNKGIHAVVRKLKSDLKNVEATQYCLKIDITKFYPSIDHTILKNIIRKKIKDKRLLNLLDNIIDSAPGVPIGNYLSQFFANLYLTYFDHWLKEQMRVKYYYRYADDMVILSNNKKELHYLLNQIKEKLKTLKLSVNPNHQIFPVYSRGIDFVGYVFYHTHVLLRKRIKKNFAKYVIKHKFEKIEQCPHYGWAVHCNSNNLLKKLSNESTIRSHAS